MNPGTQRLLLHQVHIARRSESAKRHFFNRVTVWHGIRWQSVHADQLCRNLGTIHQTCSVVVGHRSARLGEMLKPSGEIKYRVVGVQRDCSGVLIFQAALKHRAERVQMLLNYANAFPKVQIEQVKPAAIEEEKSDIEQMVEVRP
jgi:hypothetical protein